MDLLLGCKQCCTAYGIDYYCGHFMIFIKRSEPQKEELCGLRSRQEKEPSMLHVCRDDGESALILPPGHK